jgi:glycosyltransferase involved in cell wall biosynthesis
VIRIMQIMECTIGGTRRHIRELCTGLASGGGFEVTLVASAVRDPTFRDDMRQIAAAGVEVIDLPMRREIDPPRDLLHQVRIAGELGRRACDVVHTHSSKAGALGRIAALCAAPDAARVHTPHTFAFNFTEQFSPARRRFFLAVERGLGRATHRVVHVSDSERAEGARFRIVPAGRAVVIPNGIDPAPLERATGAGVRAGLGVPEQVPLVGSVGLLNEAKGFDRLVDAAVRVRARLGDVRFVVVGEGELRTTLEARIRERGLADAFLLPGYRRDVPQVMAALDLFVLPSLWEGLPYVVLEAMAARRAVVATDVNGSRDIVRPDETGLLVPSAQAEPLADAIVALLGDAKRRAAMGEAGARRVRAEYSLEVMLERYRALYRELVEEGR